MAQIDATAGACANDTNGDSRRVSGTFEIASTYVLSMSMTFSFYPGAGCLGAPVVQTDSGVGYLEVDAAEYRLWIDLSLTGRIVTGGPFTVSGLGYKFMRAFCAPTATCDGITTLIEIAP